MSYYFSKTVNSTYEETIDLVTKALKKEGFGILTEIDMQTTMKKKLDADIPKYKILGACNPPFAYQAIQSENNIGLMLPCNVIVKENNDGKIEVAAVDPVASMQAVENNELNTIATQVREKMKLLIENI